MSLVVGFSPEAVIVGGAIARAWSLIEKALTEKIESGVSAKECLRREYFARP